MTGNTMPTTQDVFITGGTGYMGSRLIPRLLARGHRVRALVRKGSEGKLPSGCDAVVGNVPGITALAPPTYSKNFSACVSIV